MNFTLTLLAGVIIGYCAGIIAERYRARLESASKSSTFHPSAPSQSHYAIDHQAESRIARASSDPGLLSSVSPYPTPVDVPAPDARWKYPTARKYARLMGYDPDTGDFVGIPSRPATIKDAVIEDQIDAMEHRDDFDYYRTNSVPFRSLHTTREEADSGWSPKFEAARDELEDAKQRVINGEPPEKPKGPPLRTVKDTLFGPKEEPSDD